MKRFIILAIAAATFATMFFSDTNFASANGRSGNGRVIGNGNLGFGRFTARVWLPAYNTFAYFEPVTGMWYIFSPAARTFVPITNAGLGAQGGLGLGTNGLPGLPQGATRLPNNANNVPVTPNNNQVQPTNPQ